MTPPELAGNAPGLDIAQPFEISLRPVLRHEPRLAVLDGFERRLGQGFRIHIPLVGQPGLDRHVGAIPERHRVFVGFDLGQKPARFHLGDNRLAGFETFQPVIFCDRRVGIAPFAGVCVDAELVAVESHIRRGIKHVDHAETAALAHFEIVEVMGRGDLHRSRALFGISVTICDDLQPATNNRQNGVFADHIGKALIIGMYGDTRIPQHGFRPRGRHGDEPALFPLDGIAEIPEIAVDFTLDHFEIRNCRVQFRIPIDQALVLVDQALTVESHKNFQDGARQAFVHGEPLARPVT